MEQIDNINLTRYLVVGAIKKNGYSNDFEKPTTRLTSTKPRTESHEVYVRLDISLPKSLYTKPQLKAIISISEDDCATRELDAQVVTSIEELAAERIGCELSITVSNN